ncbi:uncharacterized protein LOC111701019 [Eurytemora carolleeae]|uniref:uncharacterized protein LOC111701019 n=1 Tax=Eurytemora carolleeae TaxID=1294199 RepID=UPI000C763FDE|nr:uncharacterized protein LOC111701019 [Eurytemora carolleeae]|eukprot:XP_023327897.1 uncharacterized protein LOC111701019 [Eurytemora affinis]
MASSSVSQDDFEKNDFEKLERRSRIRTARARQINPQSCRLESNQERFNPLGIDIEDNLDQLHIDTASVSPFSVLDGDTSPKPGPRNQAKLSSEKRPAKLNHHGNKGKQQRDRRKLREKRRSTGVVHLASTESTGGSTTGDDEECVEGAGGAAAVGGVCVETKRNTQHNESIQDVQPSSVPVEIPERKNSGHKHQSPLYNRLRLRGDKSTRSEDMEADDEQGDKTDNDHDSINLSESNTTTPLPGGLLVETSSCLTSPLVRPTTPSIPSSTSTPVLRPTTPTHIDSITVSPEDRERCFEENKTLLAIMEEKDRRIQSDLSGYAKYYRGTLQTQGGEFYSHQNNRELEQVNPGT